ncbi:MAG: hypothetical protein KDJ47_13650 [Hyphomicrobiaceae bacterium]|nr:hypothetical protein [Hyphomicrobiaceae bacterium]
MLYRTLAGVAVIALGGILGGCANDGSGLGLTTSSLAPETKAEAAAKVDPQCVALMSKIDALRKEGTPERIEKVATGGKGSTASVKRVSLAKMTELDKANAEFQQRCSTLTPAQQAAAAPSQEAAAASASSGEAQKTATDAAKKQATKTVAKVAKSSAAKAATEEAAKAATQ